MRKLLTLLLAACLAAVAVAQDVGFLVTKKHVEPAVTAKVYELPDFLGSKQPVELLAIGGLRVENGAVYGGAALAYPFKLAKNVEARLGFYSRFVQSRPVEVGAFVGLRLTRF